LLASSDGAIPPGDALLKTVGVVRLVFVHDVPVDDVYTFVDVPDHASATNFGSDDATEAFVAPAPIERDCVKLIT
jgi:hypothetical protein